MVQFSEQTAKYVDQNRKHTVSVIFLEIVSNVRRTIVFSFVMLIPDVSLANQSEGEGGMV